MPSTHRTRLWLGTILALASLGATACGAGSQTGAATAKVVPCDFTAPAKPVTVNVLAYDSSSIDPFTDSMVKSCSKKTVTLRHDPIDFGGQYTKTPITLAARTGTYDLVEGYSALIPSFAAKGQMRPLNALFAKYKKKYDLGGLDPVMLKGFTYRGKLYGLPMQANVGLMVYRKDVFAKLDLQPPKTYAGLVSAARRIRASGAMKYPIAMPASDPSTAYEQTMSSLGTSYVDTSTGKPTFDTPQATQALQALVDLAPYMDPQATTFDQPKVQQQLYNGKAAIAIMFSGRMADLLQKTNSANSAKFGFAAPPAVTAGGKSGSAISVDGWVMPTNSKVDPDLLFQVMASSVTEQASLASMPYAYPARTSLVTDKTIPYAPAIHAALAGGAALPAPYPWFTTMEDASYTPLLKAWKGGLGVPAALASAQQAAVAALKSAG